MTLVFLLFDKPFYIKTLHDLPIKSYQKQKTSHVKMLSKRTQKLSYEEVVKLIQKENIWINSFGLMLFVLKRCTQHSQFPNLDFVFYRLQVIVNIVGT